MEGKNLDERLERSALGRIAFIGELYDARTESFSSRSLLKRTFPSDLIVCQNIGNMEFDYISTNSASDRFDLLKVQADLQVSVLLGLVSVSGSGTFLTNQVQSENSVSCSLICRISTVCEKLFASFDDIWEHIDLTALEDEKNTHVVTEINWGANCLLNLVATGASKSDKEVLKGQLSGQLEKLKQVLSMQGKGELEIEKSASESFGDIRIKVWADVAPDGGWPTSTEGFRQFMMEVPKLLKNENNGKGKPMDYAMISLNVFRRLAKPSNAIETTVRSIDESFLASTMYLLEDIAVARRKLDDFILEMTNMKEYVLDSDLELAGKHQQTLAAKESDLKLLISEQWVNVRSGKKNLRDLIREVESFKTDSLNLYDYNKYLKSTAAIHEKLALVKNFISLGVIYLGKEDSFESVLSQNISCEFLVLLMSSKTKEEDSELHTGTFHYFLTEANNPRSNTKYVVVDFDFQEEQMFLNVNVSTSKIFHLKGGKILSKDKYAEYLEDTLSNFIRVKEGAEVVHVTHKPANRVPLTMICPGFQKEACPTDVLSWTCFRCKSSVEYGFDKFYYCSCGKGQIADIEYRCHDPSHENFVEGSTDFIQKQLSSLKPLEEMNILILGYSGVGKSTWINSIVNYLNYDTLDKAREQGVICTIPARLVTYDAKSSKQYIIDIGSKDENEETSIGHSSTQLARTYSFIWKGKCVRLIDTPGLGDPRGIEQDEINLRNIIGHIGFLKELHGVCILVKATDNKLDAFFSYCLKELLVHLPRSVAKNILFCFTNARNSMYRLGQASVVVETLIRELDYVEELPLGYHNMFCLDNEAFIFLCSLTNPEITHDPELVESYRHSWKLSLKETMRLFETIASFEPHQVKETLSLVTIRSRIMSLTKPIAEISKTIQVNLSTIQNKLKEITDVNQTLEELEKKLHYEEIHLKSEPLNYPRTVCTSSKCVEYLTFKDMDVKEIEYKTHCHKHCYITNVNVLTVNNAKLRYCDAMKDGKCQNCGCGWEMHMHITESQRREPRQMKSQSVENDIIENKSTKEQAENFVKNLEELVEKYRKEQTFIIQASVKFGMLLRRIAITICNDSVAKYLEYLISEEEKKEYKSETEENLLERLKKTLEHYNAEVAIITEVMKKGDSSSEELREKDVLELEQQLYKLELTGKDIEQSVKCSRHFNSKFSKYTEIQIQISSNPRAQNSNSRLSQVKQWAEKQKAAIMDKVSNIF